jgi:hypothetical protein
MYSGLMLTRLFTEQEDWAEWVRAHVLTHPSFMVNTAGEVTCVYLFEKTVELILEEARTQ